MLCLPCLGSGEFPAGRTCPRCAGAGTLPDSRADRPMCAYCIGRGRDPFQKGQLCSVCDGWGRLPEERKESPVVPATADSNGGSRPGAPLRSEAERELPPAGGTPARPLESLLRDLTGDVDVCDPALGEDAFANLRQLRRCDMVRVLTHGVDDDALPRIRSFTREFPHFLFRRYMGRAIRDRYVLAADGIVFLGPRQENGDESPETVIRVPASIAAEMIEDVRVGYNRMWRAGNRLG